MDRQSCCRQIISEDSLRGEDQLGGSERKEPVWPFSLLGVRDAWERNALIVTCLGQNMFLPLVLRDQRPAAIARAAQEVETENIGQRQGVGAPALVATCGCCTRRGITSCARAPLRECERTSDGSRFLGL
jgi:hypothetical protein